MTAPRTPLDEFRGAGQDDLARLIGLRPSTGAPPSSSAPEPMDIPAVEREMQAILQRGGRVGPRGASDALGSSDLQQLPGGTYGGEFSDEDFAAYLDAAKKLGFAKGIEHLRPLLDARATMSARPDATRTIGR